jgi:hypothetical protein
MSYIGIGKTPLLLLAHRSVLVKKASTRRWIVGTHDTLVLILLVA